MAKDRTVCHQEKDKTNMINRLRKQIESDNYEVIDELIDILGKIS